MVISENVALPIHFFCPLSIQPSSVFLQVVVKPPATALPTSGSVKPKAPIASNCCILGNHFCFCSSEPSRYIEPIANPDCTPKKVAIEASILASSAAITPSITKGRFGHPYPSYVTPHKFNSLNLGITSKGNLSCNQ